MLFFLLCNLQYFCSIQENKYAYKIFFSANFYLRGIRSKRTTSHSKATAKTIISIGFYNYWHRSRRHI